MLIVVAPQEYKGCLTAVQVAEAIGSGVARAVPDSTVVLAPMSDGGPGMLDVLMRTLTVELCEVPCRDALRRPRVARMGLLDRRRTAIIESAEAIGLTTLNDAERDPMIAGSEGLGDLIRAALDFGVQRVIIGLGGTAGLDGGVGMARVLGARLLDRRGDEIRPGAVSLSKLHTIDISGIDARLRNGVRLLVAADVTNPLYGSEGISAIYGPQKGATSAQIVYLDEALRHYASILKQQVGYDVDMVHGVGAGGGAGAALGAVLGAELRAGFELMAEITGLEHKFAGANLVITGEGSLDRQSIFGKTTVSVARLANRYSVPVLAVCGQLGSEWHLALTCGITSAASIASGPLTLSAMTAGAPALIAEATEQILSLARALGSTSSPSSVIESCSDP